MLTNGGGITEDDRAEVVNKIIGLKPDGDDRALCGEDMILCHTPFRQEHLVKKYRDKYVIVSGLGKMYDLARLYGYEKCIDIEDFFAIYPELHPVTNQQ